MTDQDLLGRVERLRVQLAGCLTAAAGHHTGCKQGDYGWTLAYQVVADLRERFERVERELAEAQAEEELSSNLVEFLGGLLSETANILKGPPADKHLHSTHDVPQVAAELKAQLAEVVRGLEVERSAFREALAEHEARLAEAQQKLDRRAER